MPATFNEGQSLAKAPKEGGYASSGGTIQERYMRILVENGDNARIGFNICLQLNRRHMTDEIAEKSGDISAWFSDVCWQKDF
jgi:hypothetical protein